MQTPALWPNTRGGLDSCQRNDMPTIKLPDWRRSPFVAVSVHRSAHVMIRWGEAGVKLSHAPARDPIVAAEFAEAPNDGA